MKRKILFITLVLSLFISLTACGGKDDFNSSRLEKNINNDGQSEELSLVEEVVKVEKEANKKILEYDEGLVRVEIVNGEVYISFDLDKWEEKYQIRENFEFYNEDLELKEGPFKVKVHSGRVKDGYIAYISSIDFSDRTMPVPTLILTMEDGSVEWLTADPLNTYDYGKMFEELIDYDNYASHEVLSHKDNFISFSYESDKEGMGDMVVYLKNDKGEKYNFYYLWLETRLKTGRWVGNLSEMDENEESINAYIKIDSDGEFSLAFGQWYSYYTRPLVYFENWFGKADLIKLEGQEYPPGTLFLI